MSGPPWRATTFAGPGRTSGGTSPSPRLGRRRRPTHGRRGEGRGDAAADGPCPLSRPAWGARPRTVTPSPTWSRDTSSRAGAGARVTTPAWISATSSWPARGRWGVHRGPAGRGLGRGRAGPARQSLKIRR
jgi:hypothetical protein